jgi:hypothetical protein
MFRRCARRTLEGVNWASGASLIVGAPASEAPHMTEPTARAAAAAAAI